MVLLASVVTLFWATAVPAQDGPGRGAAGDQPPAPIFADHFLDGDPGPWKIVPGEGKTPAVVYHGAADDARPGMHVAPVNGTVGWAPWDVGERPFAFTTDVELLDGRAQSWRDWGAAIAVCTRPPNAMDGNDIALSFALMPQGIQASVRRGGWFQPIEEGRRAYRRYRERRLDPRYRLNMGGAGGHAYSAQYPRSRLAGLRLRLRIERTADGTIHFKTSLVEGSRELAWWEGDYALPAEHADSAFRCVAVRGILNPGDFGKLKSGKFRPARGGVRARFFAMQGRPLDGPRAPVVTGFEAARLPLGPGGMITVTGKHFDRGARAIIDGVPAKTSVQGPTRLQVQLPQPRTKGPCKLEVINATGLKGAYEQGLYYGSVVDRVEPREASPAGGDVVTVYGGGFDDDTRFSINGKAAEVVERLDAARARIKVPAGEPGPANVSARSGETLFRGQPVFGYAPHPYLWYKGADGLADLRRKLDEPMFRHYRTVLLDRARLKAHHVRVRRFGEEVGKLPSALRQPGGETGVAAQWFDRYYFDFDVKLTDRKAHQVAVYAFDYYRKGWPGPELTVEIRSPDATRVLDRRRMVLRHNHGGYLVWTIRRDVRIRVRGGNHYSAVAAGLFFDAPPADANRPSGDKAVRFVRVDRKTEGQWQGTYGGDGYWIAGEASKLPAYAQAELRQFPAGAVSHKSGSSPNISAALWMYLFTRDPNQRERVLRLVELETGVDRWGNRPAECPGHPGRLLRRVDIDQFYFHTVAAVAGVYDTLFAELTADQRARIARWLNDAVRHYATRVRRNDWWFANNPSNTIAVGSSCGGITALALKYSTADANDVLDLAAKTIRQRYKAITPDGGCVEGTLYWNYALTYQMRFGQALRNVTGDDRGMLSSDRIRNSYRFVETMLGGDGTMFSFNDTQPYLTGAVIGASLDGPADSPRPALMRWLVDEIMADCATAPPKSGYASVRADALACPLLFRSRRKGPEKFPGVPTLTYLKTLQWGAIRSDGNSFRPKLVVGVKGRGGPTTHHAQADLGSFVLHANGESYLIDPGYYENGADRHSTLLMDGGGPGAKNEARIVNAWESGQRRSMAVDLRDAYKKKLPGARRHFVMDGDRAVALLDEVPAGAAKKVTLQVQCLFEPELAKETAGVVLAGEQGRLRVECFGPEVTLKSRARQWKQRWVSPHGHDTWYTVSGVYAPSATRPMVTVFTPVGGAGQPPQATVRYADKAIEVAVDGKAVAEFAKTADGWQAVRP
jgi:hypothetical protein